MWRKPAHLDKELKETPHFFSFQILYVCFLFLFASQYMTKKVDNFVSVILIYIRPNRKILFEKVALWAQLFIDLFNTQLFNNFFKHSFHWFFLGLSTVFYCLIPLIYLIFSILLTFLAFEPVLGLLFYGS